MKKFNLLIFFWAISLFASAQKYYTVDQIPNPKIAGQDYFVSNPDGILNNVETINQLLVQLEQQTKIEFAIVAVKDFDKSQEDFEFAKAIFDNWRIGKAGSNNGLLLLISIDRKKYRFISGSGVEGLLPDVVLKQIGENYLVPAFKEQLYDEGVKNAINAINDKLTNPQSRAEVQSLISQEKQQSYGWKFALISSVLLIVVFVIVFKIISRQVKNIQKVNKANKNNYDQVIAKGCTGIFIVVFISLFILFFTDSFGIFENIGFKDIPLILYVIFALAIFFRYYSVIGNIRRVHNDDENFFDAVRSFHQKNWWLIIFSPLVLIALIIHGFKRVKTIDRFKPILDSRNNLMVRLDRDINVEGKPFLTEGQRKEEIVKAYDYDIWESEDKKEHVIKAWPAEEYNDFTKCPSCEFRTYKLNKRETVTPATYSHSGQAKLINECSFCKHIEFIKWITLAKLVESSSSSSSSSSGGSSSSSSSGSFGGGSSSGGGAGGSW